MVSSDVLRIRKATEQDLHAITEIYNEAILYGTATFDTELKSLNNRRLWLRQHSDMYPALVAETREGVVGWGSLSRWSDRCAYDSTAELSIYFHTDHRGKGYGKVLMRELLEAGKKGGLHTVISRITQGNDASIYLHTLYGFTTIGVMKEVGKKFGQLLDVTMMQKML